MRNLLMTKFGTPTGAGPGRPSVSVGLSRVGEPSGRRMSPGFVCLRFFGFAGSPSGRNSPGDFLVSVCGLSAVSSPPLSCARCLGCGGPTVLDLLDRCAEFRKLDRLGRGAGRNVDGGHDLLAADEGDGDGAQLGERGERRKAEAGDEQRHRQHTEENLPRHPQKASPSAAGAPSNPAPTTSAGTLPHEMPTLPTEPPSCNAEPRAARRHSSPAAVPCLNLDASHGAMIIGSAWLRGT